MPKIRVNVSAYSFNTSVQRAFGSNGSIYKNIAKIAHDATESVALRGAEVAQDMFENAAYDGVNDVKVEAVQSKAGNWAIRASGESVKYIEYGTGYNHNGEYWYFSGDPNAKGFQLTATGEHAMTKVKRYKLPQGDKAIDYQSMVSEYNARIQRAKALEAKDPIKYATYMRYTGGRREGEYVQISAFLKKYNVGYKWVQKEHSFRSKGNPPNKCIPRTIEQLQQEMPTILRQRRGGW